MISGDDSSSKLPSIRQSSSSGFRPHGGRPRNSINPGFLPNLSSFVTPRLDTNRTQRGAAHRATTVLFRPRAESISVHSSTQRYNHSDVKRYLTAAATKSNATKERFFEQLKTYKTFSPLVIENEVYGGKRRTSARSSIGWGDVDKVLDNAHAIVDRHGADGSFLMTVESALPLPATSESETPKESSQALNDSLLPLDNQKLASARDHSMFSKPLGPLSPATIHAEKEQAIFASWMRGHPSATPKEIRQELRFRHSELTRHERLLRMRYRRAIEEECAKEESLLPRHSLEPRAIPSADFLPSATSPSPSCATVSARVLSPQAVAWESFLSVAEGAPRRRFETFCGDRKKKKKNEAAEKLRVWLDGAWRSHTHRHEIAAVRIQCAYRCYRAARVAAQRRYNFRLSFLNAQRAEETPARLWAAARRASAEAQKRDAMHNVPLRALHCVCAKFEAIALRRRKERDATLRQREEIETHAAVTIQRVFRGHCGRLAAAMVRNPELRVARQRQRTNRAAIAIQRVFRGYRARVTRRRAERAAFVIQRAFRAAAARARRVQLRARAAAKERGEAEEHAARIVTRALREWTARRRAYLRARANELSVLQRIGRGCIARQCAKALGAKENKKVNAAVVVQRLWRRHQLRKERRAQWQEILRREAAEMILRFFRTAHTRKEVKKEL